MCGATTGNAEGEWAGEQDRRGGYERGARTRGGSTQLGQGRGAPAGVQAFVALAALVAGLQRLYAAFSKGGFRVYIDAPEVIVNVLFLFFLFIVEPIHSVNPKEKKKD